ncbi:ROK family protein [Kribbella sp. NPDC050124]|uniref:ROK family protein n=1 Tax=Kribbella sp. NPDC050124 TaxID=3364114 RepID=UPI0037BD81C3
MMKPSVSARDVLVLAHILELVRSGEAATRAQLEAATGFGRTIVNDRLREGLNLGLLADGDQAPSSGGRPSRTVRFRAEAGLLLSASLGAFECRAAVSDLAGELIATSETPLDVTDPPESVLTRVDELFTDLLAKAPGKRPLWGIGIGVPGPVDFRTGRVVAPPIMPGWDGFDIRSWFRTRYEAPIWVDNEVNLMAYGEWSRGEPQDRHDLLYVKVSAGIGSGLVTGSRLHRGASGAAGDIGHARVTDDPAAVCRCGKTGCLEAVAGGWALVRKLTDAAQAGQSTFLANRLNERGRLMPEDIGASVEAGDTVTLDAVQQAARHVGRAVAGIVNFANPSTLVLGGGVLRMGDVFFDVFRDQVLDGTIELAARGLTIRRSSLDFLEGVYGATSLAMFRLFRREAMELWLGNGSPIGSALRLQQAS